MSGLPLLLEIGVEEIPDWMIPGALASLRESFVKLGIAHDSIAMDATPRRLVLRAVELAERQPDAEDLVSGPPVSAAFKDGQPTGAALRRGGSRRRSVS